MYLFVFITALLASTQGVYAGFNPSSMQNIAVYWGQNSYGAGSGSLAQQRLSYYCANTNINIIPLAFLTAFNGQGGQPTMNFANAGDNCTVFSGTQTFNCPQLAQDIQTCQSTYGKTILLSIGGATYTEGGFSSSSAAVSEANLIWATFGPQQSGSSALRPFGSSAVDGFDFDFEATVNNVAPFANQLRSLMSANTQSSGRKWYLTAAPQCPYPDAADNQMLNGAVAFDAVFVQFYNNYCGSQSFVAGATTQNNFNFATWDNWAKTVSKNPAVKVFLGVPASTTAAGSGYESPANLLPVIKYCKQFSSFGGVMMWDASQAIANSGFLSGVASDLAAPASRIMRWMA